MTVKTVNESQERVSGFVSVSELQKPKEPLSTKLTMEFFNLVGQTVTKVDRRVVGTKGCPTRKNTKHTCSQILTIREEDSHLGEDCSWQSKTALSLTGTDLLPRPILLSSPLSGKTATQKALR